MADGSFTRRIVLFLTTAALAGCGMGDATGLDAAPESDSELALSNGARVVYVGDSIAYESASVVKRHLEARGVLFAAAAKGGLAICDYFPETSSTFRSYGEPSPPNLRDLVAFARPHVVVMQFWGNSWAFTPCMKDGAGNVLAPGTAAYFERYLSDAHRAMEIIRDAASSVGSPMPAVLWILQGPDSNSATRTRTLNEGYASLRSRWPTASTIDAGKTVSLAANYWNPGDRYGWAQYLPCTDEERGDGTCVNAYGGVAKIHADNDFLHFCLGAVTATGCQVPSPGVNRYARAIAEATLRELNRCRASAKLPARLALKTYDGHYVVAEGGGAGWLNASRTSAREWETFTSTAFECGSSLRAVNGKYVAAEGSGGQGLIANRATVGAWERFGIEDLGKGKVALRASNGQYLSAIGGGGGELVANRTRIDIWETFTVVPMP